MPLHTNIIQKEDTFSERKQIEYLLSNPSTWMMNYGIMLMTGFFILVITLSYFIHYPDVLEARVVLTTTNPPIRIISKASGRVTELLVIERQKVKKDDVLAILESTASWREVLSLENWLNATNEQVQSEEPDDLLLGELQSIYSTYYQHKKDLEYFILNNGVEIHVNFINTQIYQIGLLNEILQKQQLIMASELSLHEKEFKRQQILYNDKVISESDFDASTTQLLTIKCQIESNESGFLQNRIQVNLLKGQINDLYQGKSDTYNSKKQTLDEDILRLRSAISEWKKIHLITSPINGYISLSKIWGAEQPIATGDEILAIVPIPSGMHSIIAKATVPSLNFGKIVPGQRVILQLDGYPQQEYGSLMTTINSTSILPQNGEKGSFYIIDLHFPDSLITTQGISIPLHQEMPGLARIVTEDRRIIDRIFGNIRKLLGNKVY